MSTVYYTNPIIPSIAALKAGLPEGIIVRDVPPAYQGLCLCLSDGQSGIWAHEDDGGVVFERYGANSVDRIFTLLAPAFGVKFEDEFEFPWEPPSQ